MRGPPDARSAGPYLYVLVRGLPSEGDKGEAAHGVALPPRAAGGFYLGLAIPATAGDGDGTRADADAADGCDAEQEQVGTGGGQAARRRPGGYRGGGATRVVTRRGVAGRGVAAVGRAAVRRKLSPGRYGADLS